jgi:DNA replication protein DnaC
MMICLRAVERRWPMDKKKDIKALLSRYLKELFLNTMRQCYEDLANQARQESLSYDQYLLTLAEQEWITRRNNRIEKNLKESKIPRNKSIDTFDLKRVPGKVAQQARTLLEGSFVDHKENILAFGNPGSGKTHLLCAIGQELIRNGRKVYFTTCSLLVQDLLKAKQELQLSRALKKLSKYDALIIDDIGYVQQDRSEMEVLFTLLADRYERGSVMITSNLPFSKWEQIFKDPMVTAAAIDRLVHHSVILELNIESYRMEAAKKKKSKKTDGPAKGTK